MLEKTLEASCCKRIQTTLGWKNIKVTSPHHPDRMFYKGGRYFWVEFKATWGELSPMQEFTIAELVKHGETVFVISTKEAFIKEVCEYARNIDARRVPEESHNLVG